MRRGNSWDLNFSVTVYFNKDKPLSDKANELLSFTGDEKGDIVFQCSSKGGFTPGVFSGAPEKCYPDDFEDERIAESALVSCNGKCVAIKDSGLLEILQEQFNDEIYDEELPFDPEESNEEWFRDNY